MLSFVQFFAFILTTAPRIEIQGGVGYPSPRLTDRVDAIRKFVLSHRLDNGRTRSIHNLVRTRTPKVSSAA